MRDQQDEWRVAIKCRNQIDRALRQLDRLHEAHVVRHEATQRSGFVSGTKPKDLVDLDTDFNDHLYFAILAVNHALKAAKVLGARGVAVPEVRQSAALWAWRDVVEHWDAPELGRPLRALERWQSASRSSAPGSCYMMVDDQLSEVSGVKLRRLAIDLRKLRDSAEQVCEREWNYWCLTAQQAADLMGMSIEEFDNLPVQPHYINYGTEHGIRYLRESVVRHARPTAGWRSPKPVV